MDAVLTCPTAGDTVKFPRSAIWLLLTNRKAMPAMRTAMTFSSSVFQG
jgi:hypothetical protein